MVVRLRLSRQGTKNNPFYHLVAIADHKPRDARPIEKLGEYDPIPRRIPILPKPNSTSNSTSTNSKGKAIEKNSGQLITSGLPTGFRLEKRLEWDQSRIKHWLEKGAQPSRPVAKLLDRVSNWMGNVLNLVGWDQKEWEEGEKSISSLESKSSGRLRQNKRLFALQTLLKWFSTSCLFTRTSLLFNGISQISGLARSRRPLTLLCPSLLDPQAGLVPPNVFYKGMFRPTTTTTESPNTSSSSSPSSSSVVEPSTTPIEQRTVPPEQVLDSTNSNTSDADKVGRESLKTMDQASWKRWEGNDGIESRESCGGREL